MPDLKPRTTTVVLFQGDDIDEARKLNTAVREAAILAKTAGPKRIGDDTPTLTDAAKAYDAFVAEAAERGVKVEIQAVGRKVWRELLEKHPPRQIDEVEAGEVSKVTHPEDAGWGFNFQTLADDLVPASVVDKVSFSEAWLDMLSDAEWSQIYRAALQLNRGAAPDPLVSLSSRAGRILDEISE